MEMSVLRELWKAKNPDGNIWISDGLKLLESGKQTGKFAVKYNQDGKIYNYSASSVYKLAERFNLIPDSNINYFEESRKAIRSMLSGKSFSTIAGLHDTIRHICESEFNCYIDFKSTESKDIYDRVVYTFTMIKKYSNHSEYAKIRGW
jgi:hypothetical protein